MPEAATEQAEAMTATVPERFFTEFDEKNMSIRFMGPEGARESVKGLTCRLKVDAARYLDEVLKETNPSEDEKGILAEQNGTFAVFDKGSYSLTIIAPQGYEKGEDVKKALKDYKTASFKVPYSIRGSVEEPSIIASQYERFKNL